MCDKTTFAAILSSADSAARPANLSPDFSSLALAITSYKPLN